MKLKRSRSCSCSGSVVEVVAVVWRSAVAAVYLSVYVNIYIYICLYMCLSVYPSISLSICKLENEAILRDFLNF